MNKALIGFAIGVTAGSLVTLVIVDKKYRKLAEEEIEAVRDYYKNRDKADGMVTLKHNMDKAFDVVADDIIPAMDFPKIPEDQYKKIVEDMGYTNEEMEELLEDPDVSVEKNEDGEYEIFVEPGEEKVLPYLIEPEEYGESDYDTQCLTYYADFVLTDEDDEIISDKESIIGDALEHFGDYADDSVYVRNDNTRCDYEIIKHKRTFSEIYGRDY